MFQFYKDLNAWMQLLLIIPIVIGTIKYRKLDFPLKIIYYYVLFDAIINIILYILDKNNITNLFFINLFSIIEFFVLVLVYSRILINKNILWLVKASYFIFLFVVLYTFVFYQQLNEFANHLKIFESTFLIIFASSYLYSKISNEGDIAKDAYSWFSIAVLMYFITTILVYGSFQVIAKLEKTVFMKIWTIKNSLTWLYFIIIGVAFYIQAKYSNQKVNSDSDLI